jgi:hypothetical protein
MLSWTFTNIIKLFFLIAIVDLYECSKILSIPLTQDQTGGELPNQGLTGSFLLPLLYLSCTTNQSSIPNEYLFLSAGSGSSGSSSMFSAALLPKDLT